MDDLISRDEAIEALYQWMRKPSNNEEWQELLGVIHGLPAARPDLPDTNVGDMISRQAALDALKKMTFIQHTIIGDMSLMNAENVIDRIKALPSAQPEPRWIPCSEKLPDDEADILVTYVDGEETKIVPVNYGRGTWYDCIFDRALNPFKIIAWMPLPKAYERSEDGQ